MDKYWKDWEKIISELKLNSECGSMAWYSFDGELLAASKSMCVFLGTTQAELKPAHFLVNPDFNRLKQFSASDKKIFEGMLTIGNYSDVSFVLEAKIFKDKDIYFIYAEADAVSLFQDNQKMSRLNQEVHNLQRQLVKEKSKLEHTLKKLRETQQMLIHSEKMNALGQMVAGVAHEINNPIAFVTNNLYELKKYTGEIFDAFAELESSFKTSENHSASEVLQEIKDKYEFEYLTEDVTDVLTESQGGVERVKKIVEDLRRFSRLDESDIKHIDLVENIQSTLSIIQPQLAKKEIDFEMQAPEKLMMDCFPGQLNQALLNILVNANDAVEKKGKIILSMKESAEAIIISVIDNGSGIPKESIDKIFNPFYTTKPVGSGTGLGLSITYKIITDLHKGKLEATSAPGETTTFTITLPKRI